MHGPYPGELRVRVIRFVEGGGSRREAAEQICALVAMTCEKPSESERPITHWSRLDLGLRSAYQLPELFITLAAPIAPTQGHHRLTARMACRLSTIAS